MSKWYVDKGEQGDIVLSTRVRLARNLEEFPFPCRLDTASKIKVNEKVRDTLLSCVPELGLHGFAQPRAGDIPRRAPSDKP